MLNRDQILSRSELRREKISVPEWGGDVFVSEMTGQSRDDFEFAMEEKDAQGRVPNVRAKLAAATVTDEQGNLIFSEPGDIEKLSKQPARVLSMICRVAQRINGITGAELKAAEGNSSAAPSGDSTSV